MMIPAINFPIAPILVQELVHWRNWTLTFVQILGWSARTSLYEAGLVSLQMKSLQSTAQSRLVWYDKCRNSVISMPLDDHVS